MLQIELNETAWNDGRAVSADDFIFAWKRLLEPEYSGEAASLLYDIKNARAVKNGDMTIDDVGLYAADITVLQVEFERSVDYELFMETCASPALYPLREDKVVKLTDWASNPSTMVTNGPFFVKKFAPGVQMDLERNVYYYRNVEKEESLFKSVTPYRFVIFFAHDEVKQYENFSAGLIQFDNVIPLAQRSSVKAETSDTLTNHTYIFNTRKAPFDKPEVRKALSMALDRNAIVDIVTFAKPATGIITEGVYENAKRDSFRKNGGDLIASTADVAGAKSLLSGAGVNGGNFTITIKPNEIDRAVAEYISGVWSQLGFSVAIKELGAEYYVDLASEYEQYRDLFENAYKDRDFDVIAIDYTMLSTDPFGTLAMFAKPFSGGAIDIVGGNYEAVPSVSGYSDDTYDALIEEAFGITVRADRSAKLHDAEKKLVDAMPIMPLFTYVDAYVKSGDLSNIKTTFYGNKIFNKSNFKGYLEFDETFTTIGAADNPA
jgi:ABC-type oligopeptide transport system substrate-binding subunit